MDILAEGGAVTERASIDECYLDVTEVAQQMLRDAGGQPPLPLPHLLAQIHVCGAVSFRKEASCSGHLLLWPVICAAAGAVACTLL